MSYVFDLARAYRPNRKLVQYFLYGHVSVFWYILPDKGQVPSTADFYPKIQKIKFHAKLKSATWPKYQVVRTRTKNSKYRRGLNFNLGGNWLQMIDKTKNFSEDSKQIENLNRSYQRARKFIIQNTEIYRKHAFLIPKTYFILTPDCLLLLSK